MKPLSLTDAALLLGLALLGGVGGYVAVATVRAPAAAPPPAPPSPACVESVQGVRARSDSVRARLDMLEQAAQELRESGAEDTDAPAE